jgi:hypothetical protein
VDWECPDGVRPAARWYAHPNACEKIDSWGFNDFGPGPIQAWWSPKLRYMTIKGSVNVEHYEDGAQSKGSINVRIRADGAYTETVMSQTGTHLVLRRTRTGAVARGRILFTALNGPGYRSSADDPVVFSEYDRVP